MIEPIFQSFYKDIPPSKISLSHPRPFKSDGLAQSLTTFNKFSLQHLVNHKRHRLFLEGCLKIPKLLPSSQKDTIEINTLFAIFSNKQLENFKVRPNHTMLKEMDAGLWKVFSNLNTMKLVTQNYQKK